MIPVASMPSHEQGDDFDLSTGTSNAHAIGGFLRAVLREVMGKPEWSEFERICGEQKWGSENNVFKEFHPKGKGEKSGGFYLYMLFYVFRLVFSKCVLPF